MSEVKRLNFTVSQFDNVVPYASEHGRYVRYADYAKLEAEAQALRDQVKALQSDASSYQSGYDEGRRMGTKHRQSEVEQLTREVEALRARVVVVPDVTGYWDGLYPAQLRAPHGGPVGFYTIPMVRTDELELINGKVVSEGLLRRLSALFPTEMGDDGSGRAGWLPHVRETVAELRALLGEGKES